MDTSGGGVDTTTRPAPAAQRPPARPPSCVCVCATQRQLCGGARGSILTKFQLKRRHLDLIHGRFNDFGPFWAYFCVQQTHLSVFNRNIFLCSTNTICLCATETAVYVPHRNSCVAQKQLSLCGTKTTAFVWHRHSCLCVAQTQLSCLLRVAHTHTHTHTHTQVGGRRRAAWAQVSV